MFGECHSIILFLFQNIYRLYLLFLYFKMSYFMSIKVILLVKDLKSIESC